MCDWNGDTAVSVANYGTEIDEVATFSVFCFFWITIVMFSCAKVYMD